MKHGWLFALAALALPASASATIYKWTDENGRTVYSNRLPANGKLAQQAKAVVEDESPPPEAAEQAALARQRALEQRVAELERQLAAQPQYTPPVQYYAPPPPPPSMYYGDSYYPYYPGYYPYYTVISARRFVRPSPFFASRPVGFHHSRVGARFSGGSRR